MSLSVSKGMVIDAAKQLNRSWEKARRDWDDDTARAFHAEFLDPLPGKLRAAVEAMDALAAASARAERECS